MSKQTTNFYAYCVFAGCGFANGEGYYFEAEDVESAKQKVVDHMEGPMTSFDLYNYTESIEEYDLIETVTVEEN